MLLLTWVYIYLFEALISVLLGIYPEVELLDHMAILFLLFWGTTVLFSTAPVAFYIPINIGLVCIRVPISPHPHKHLLFPGVFIVSIHMGMRWYLIMVLIQETI